MNARDIQHFKNILEKEKTLLEGELRTVGQINPSNPTDWQATSGTIEVDSADENEVADKLEELEDNTAIVKQLDTQLKEVVAALGRIETGSYGVCEVSGEPIERERLEANPAARTSLKHMKKS